MPRQPTTIYFTRTIDSSHVIENHPGKCGRLHGHTYRFEIWMRGPVNPDDGFVIDFLDVKAAIDAWDHRHLNDLVDYLPTAENLAADMHGQIVALLAERHGDDAVSARLRLWETPDSYAEVGELS